MQGTGSIAEYANLSRIIIAVVILEHSSIEIQK